MRATSTDLSALRLNLSVDDAATALGVSPRTVRSLIASQQLPVVRIGRRVLVSLEALTEWNRRRMEKHAID